MTAGDSRFPRAESRNALLPTVLAVGALLLPSTVLAQVVPDSTRTPPDTLQVEVPEDTLALQEVQGDTLPAVEVPNLVVPLSEGWHTGVWVFDRDEILGSKAITLGEFLDEIPGLVPLRGGDYGTPVGVSAFGAGGGQVRVVRDGIELLPQEGSVVDLSRIGIAGLRSIRIIRSVGEIRIELESVLAEGGRPYSLIEAGTGDLNTNLFRGTFSHPRALGGIVALTMERIDTRGPRGQEPSITQGAWIRYARSLLGRGVLMVDYGSRASNRGDLYGPTKASRSDWSIRSRWSLSSRLVGDLYYGSSSISTEETDTFAFDVESRTQIGAQLGFDSEWVQASAHLRRLSGEGIPGTTARGQVQALLGRYGGASAELAWEDWDERSLTRNRLRIWTAPLWGLSLFAEKGSGDFGLPYLPSLPPPPVDTTSGAEVEGSSADSMASVIPGPRFSGQSGSRYGAQFQWRGLSLAGALLKAESDSLFLLGLPTDRIGATQAGGSRDGFEVSGRVPLYPKGLSLTGWWQKWDQAEDVFSTPADTAADPELVTEDQLPWRYLPRQSYQASLSFHDVFKESGNLEVWFDLGVRGRDPMAVPFLQEVDVGEEEPRWVPTMVPFYQSWYVRLQIRIVTVRVFFMWENFTVRQKNQDFPDRILPATRSLYGVRWTLWN